MSDQDMIDAGVNTIGARRKLLKVFENVQRHCNENVSLFLKRSSITFIFNYFYSIGYRILIYKSVACQKRKKKN